MNATPVLNYDGHEWAELCRWLEAERADLYERLAAPPSKGDNPNILRGRIVQINELLSLKRQHANRLKENPQ